MSEGGGRATDDAQAATTGGDGGGLTTVSHSSPAAASPAGVASSHPTPGAAGNAAELQELSVEDATGIAGVQPLQRSRPAALQISDVVTTHTVTPSSAAGMQAAPAPVTVMNKDEALRVAASIELRVEQRLVGGDACAAVAFPLRGAQLHCFAQLRCECARPAHTQGCTHVFCDVQKWMNAKQYVLWMHKAHWLRGSLLAIVATNAYVARTPVSSHTRRCRARGTQVHAPLIALLLQV
ncbi:MAG: hypothetical protein EOO41_02190 [Methanobacteriota archaeon]|nr:MAG: hypothetical protein EOO41_02190 [Euryarchaeota archaeon]